MTNKEKAVKLVEALIESKPIKKGKLSGNKGVSLKEIVSLGGYPFEDATYEPKWKVDREFGCLRDYNCIPDYTLLLFASLEDYAKGAESEESVEELKTNGEADVNDGCGTAKLLPDGKVIEASAL